MATEIFQNLGRLFRRDKKDTDLGAEGGYAPYMDSHEQAFDYIMSAIKESGYKAGGDIHLGLDVAASELYHPDSKMYHLELDQTDYTSEEFMEFLLQTMKKYPILAIEDPLDEDDWATWVKMTAVATKINPQISLIGDDIFVTNIKRFQQGIDKSVANSILVKPNQIGTLSETLACIRLAKANNYQVAISHRSGETIDSFISDLTVGVGAEFIKAGSMARGERTAKYNRLLNIETELYGG